MEKAYCVCPIASLLWDSELPPEDPKASGYRKMKNANSTLVMRMERREMVATISIFSSDTLGLLEVGHSINWPISLFLSHHAWYIRKSQRRGAMGQGRQGTVGFAARSGDHKAGWKKTFWECLTISSVVFLFFGEESRSLNLSYPSTPRLSLPSNPILCSCTHSLVHWWLPKAQPNIVHL